LIRKRIDALLVSMQYAATEEKKRSIQKRIKALYTTLEYAKVN
jgi:hypothetical protein